MVSLSLVGHLAQVLEGYFAATLHLAVVLFHASTGRTTNVEGPHGQLGAGLADRLGGDDADRQSAFAQLAAGEVHAVAAGANTQAGLAGEHTAHTDLFVAQDLDACGDVLGDDLVLAHHDFVEHGIDDRVPGHAATDGLGQCDRHAIALEDNRFGQTAQGAAVVGGDHHVLGHVGQLTGEVTGVGRLERRVRQPFPRTVGGREVLEHFQAFAEVGFDGRFDDVAGGLGHQATHSA